MSITTSSTGVANQAHHRRALHELCRIEATLTLRRASIWVGLTGTILLAVANAKSEPNWSGAKYESMIPVVIGPLMIGTFVAAVRNGSRDRSTRRPPLAEEAPLDDDDRAWARLFGLVVPVGIAGLVTAVIAVWSRVEGGYWIGEWPRRTLTANYSVLELLQPVLVVAATGAVGVALGRLVRRPGPVIVIGMVVLFLSGALYWAWNAPGVNAVTPLQTQPLRVDLPIGTDPTALPADWLVSYPDEYDGWERVLVHTPTVVFHDLYLAGLTVLFCGLALRRSPRRLLVVGGSLTAVLGVGTQIALSPRW